MNLKDIIKWFLIWAGIAIFGIAFKLFILSPVYYNNQLVLDEGIVIEMAFVSLLILILGKLFNRK